MMAFLTKMLYGIAPCRIDILTSIGGLKFEGAFARSELLEIEGILVHVLSISGERFPNAYSPVMCS
jgi:hypothetical protein